MIFFVVIDVVPPVESRTANRDRRVFKHPAASKPTLLCRRKAGLETILLFSLPGRFSFFTGMLVIISMCPTGRRKDQ